MDDAVPAQFSACDELMVGLEACSLERRTFGRNPVGLASSLEKHEATETIAMKTLGRTRKLRWQRGRGG